MATGNASRGSARRVDVLTHRPRPRTTLPGHVVGAKPAEFARWIFDLLGAQAGDELHDLFPGTGGIARAWDRFTTSGDVTGSETITQHNK